MKSVLVINGPNLNLLGERDPGHYGNESLEQINASLKERADKAGVEIFFFQSNSEGDIIDELQEYRLNIDALIINPGALTHYSYALRDALEVLDVPIIEVHLSNIHKREEWRKQSLTADVASGIIAGFRGDSYRIALDHLLKTAS